MKHALLLLMALLCLEISVTAQTELWSMAPLGGTHGNGAIYKISSDGTTYTPVYNFLVTSSQGSTPMYSAPVQASDGKLYGMTTEGGIYKQGVIYKYDISTTAYTILYHFTGEADGGLPFGSLMQASNGLLYGMTSSGGNGSNLGVIFSFDPVTNIYTKIYNFNNTNGAKPKGGFIQASNGLLYAMISDGGNSGLGVIISFDLNTSAVTKLFNMTVASGHTPNGNLFQGSNGKLYGLTQGGGTSNVGVLFSYDINTNTHSVRYNFSNVSGGYIPYGSLVQSAAGLFYGTTSIGGTNADGVLYSWNDVSSTYTILRNFNSSSATDGGKPHGSLVLASNGKLYGTTTIDGTVGGGNSYGTIFSYEISTSTYARLVVFSGTNSKNPESQLIQASNGRLYGVSTEGGTGDMGTLYSYNITSSAYTRLISFNQRLNGAEPSGALFKASNGLIYGLTEFGGSNNSGVLFSINPATNAFTKLYDFPFATYAKGGLMQASNGKLYGMTKTGGANGYGTIFSYDYSTSTFTTVYSLAALTGWDPHGNLMQASNGKLYGMTRYGGAPNKGVIFSFDYSTSTYTDLFDFTGADNGERPTGSLIQASNGKLYGGTTIGGTSGNGAIFSFNYTTLAFTKIMDCSSVNGNTIYGTPVIANDGKIYVSVAYSGTLAGGTIIKVDPATDSFTKVFDLHSTLHGYSAMGTLFKASDGKLYGTTYGSGANGKGTIFNFDVTTNTLTNLRNLEFPDAYNHVYSGFVETALTITTGSIADPICAGTTISVPYTIVGTYGQSNIFTAQLSDANGSFSSPVDIGSLLAVGSSTITATIPANTIPGEGYRVRVISSAPAVTGTSNPTLLTIRAFNKPFIIETMGNVAATTTITAHESANGFDNDSYTMSGTADVRSSISFSSGYSGASGGAYVYFVTNASGRTF